MNPTLQFPDGIDAEIFLRDYWQQRPLLMHQALPGVVNPLEPDVLAGLACEPEVEARLLIEHGESPWQLQHGPFGDADFAALPDRHWTLLVQDVDKHVPEAAALLDHFAFLPRWRMDDLMISYAPDQGSVGPHVDAYDVFLVQTLGHRRWRISDRAYNDDDMLPDLDIRVLRDFHTEQEWLLAPGDVLYLPPGVAHWGVAEGEHCMTCSVGFRSPSQHELASSWFDTLLTRADDRQRYRDPASLTPGLGGQIPTDAVATVRTLLDSLRNWSDNELADWFGRYITEPKPQLLPALPETPLDLTALTQQLSEGAELRAHPHARLAFTVPQDGASLLFADGECFALDTIDPGLQALCNRQTAGLSQLAVEHYPLLTRLYNQGSLQWDWEAADDLYD